MGGGGGGGEGFNVFKFFYLQNKLDIEQIFNYSNLSHGTQEAITSMSPVVAAPFRSIEPSFSQYFYTIG